MARPELSAEVQTELLRFLGVYDDGRLPDGMLLWATPDASGRNRDSSRPSMRQLEKHGSRSSRVASQRDDARRAGATIVSEGYLYKMAISSSNQAWRRRYFVLSANGLFAYYASKTATAPKGVIMLSPDFYVADSLNRQFGFQLSDFTQTFYMAAECAAARAIPGVAQHRRAQFGSTHTRRPLSSTPLCRSEREKMMFMFRLGGVLKALGDQAEGALSLGILEETMGEVDAELERDTARSGRDAVGALECDGVDEEASRTAAVSSAA